MKKLNGIDRQNRIPYDKRLGSPDAQTRMQIGIILGSPLGRFEGSLDDTMMDKEGNKAGIPARKALGALDSGRLLKPLKTYSEYYPQFHQEIEREPWMEHMRGLRLLM